MNFIDIHTLDPWDCTGLFIPKEFAFHPEEGEFQKIEPWATTQIFISIIGGHHPTVHEGDEAILALPDFSDSHECEHGGLMPKPVMVPLTSVGMIREVLETEHGLPSNTPVCLYGFECKDMVSKRRVIELWRDVLKGRAENLVAGFRLMNDFLEDAPLTVVK